MNHLEELEQSVIQWADTRGIFINATPYKQAQKTLEECGELLHAIGLSNADDTPEGQEFAADEIKDAIGDIIVTLIIQSKMQGLTLTDCLQSAYDVIKDRKGAMVNGQFVKEN